MPGPAQSSRIRTVGRYALYREIASGGMASVHLGRLVGPVGFARTVAIKRLHPQYARDPEFVAMFMDEARLAARVQHLNVVPTLDVVDTGGELYVVMEYVQGDSLAALVQKTRDRGGVVPPAIVCAIVAGALHGLHAAHEVRDELGAPLCIVHRDVSPQNIIVGVDGVARVLDFGVAKATMRMQATREGQVKGKLRYMSPEQIAGNADHRTDIWAAGVVLWEALTGQKLFDGDNAAVILSRALEDPIPPPSSVRRSVPSALDTVVLRALERDVRRRFQTAREMAVALEYAGVAPASQVGEFVSAACGDVLARRSAEIAEIERSESGAESMVRVRAPEPARGDTTVVEGPLFVPASGGVGAASQVSSVSVTSSTTRERPRESVRVALLAALVVGVTVAVAVVAVATSRSGDAGSTASGVSAMPPALAAPPPEAKPDAAPADSELAPVPVDELPIQAPAPTVTAKATHPIPRPVVAPKPANCAVPYTVGADGIKRPKPECM